MAHRFVIGKIRAGEFVAKLKPNSETIFRTGACASKAGARNAIASILKDGPGTPIPVTPRGESDQDCTASSPSPEGEGCVKLIVFTSNRAP